MTSPTHHTAGARDPHPYPMDDVRFAANLARLETLGVRERELRGVAGLPEAGLDPRSPAESLRVVAQRRAEGETLRGLGAAGEELAAAQDERRQLLGELAAGLPHDTWLQHPLDPRDALILHRDAGGAPCLRYGPWRLASHAPPGSHPESVCRAGEALWSGLAARSWRVVKTALWAVLATTTPALLFGAGGPDPVYGGAAGADAAAQLLAVLLWELPPFVGSVLWLVACARLCLLGYFLLFRFFEPGGEILAQDRALAASRTGPPHEANGPVPAERTG